MCNSGNCDIAAHAHGMVCDTAAVNATADPIVMSFTVFILAIFVGYHVVWNVTPALHTPLMSVTNALSSIVIVGAIIASGPIEMNLATVLGLVAVGLASVNIFGGFMVTQRMLAMFKKRS